MLRFFALCGCMWTTLARMAHPVFHFQMLTNDPEAAQTFYSHLFGWTVSAPDGIGFRRIDTNTEEGIRGGMWPLDHEGAQPFVQLFVGTDDVGASVAEAVRLGARVEVPPTKLPGGDEVAIIHDPQGIPVGLWRKG